MIIDAHTHIFHRIHGRVAQGPTRNGEWGEVMCGGQSQAVLPPVHIHAGFNAESLNRYMEMENVSKAVLLQGCFYGDQNKAVKEALIQSGGKLAGAMYLEPFHADAPAIFEEWAPWFKAVKLECSEATGFAGWGVELRLSDYLWLYRGMAERQMVLVLDLGAAGTLGYQTDEVKKIIDAVPELKIVLCHLCQPRETYLKDAALMDAWKCQLQLTRYGRVWLDTASLASYFQHETYPYATGRRFFETALNIAGADRIMAGSDLPGNTFVASYRQLLDLPRIYANQINLNEHEINAIMGRNANFVYFGESEECGQ